MKYVKHWTSCDILTFSSARNLLPRQLYTDILNWKLDQSGKALLQYLDWGKVLPIFSAVSWSPQYHVAHQDEIEQWRHNAVTPLYSLQCVCKREVMHYFYVSPMLNMCSTTPVRSNLLHVIWKVFFVNNSTVCEWQLICRTAGCFHTL